MIDVLNWIAQNKDTAFGIGLFAVFLIYVARN